MQLRLTHIFLIGLMLSALGMPSAGAQCLDLGTYHSPKGFGLCADKQVSDRSFESYTILADVTGVLLGTRASIGGKGTYTYNFVFARGVVDSNVPVDFYAGPGVTAGFVRDLNTDYGVVFGLSGTLGCKAHFTRNVSIGLDVGTDLAMFFTKGRRYGNIDITSYKAGLVRSFYPQLRLMYSFK